MNNPVRPASIGAAVVVVCCVSLLNMARADVLGSVQWAGREATSDALKGKTVVVMSFVTWCPICNKWVPEMLDEIKADSADKPVVVLAIATDVDAAAAKAYMVKRNFTGPNILYGSDATINTQLGVDGKMLWNFGLFTPNGKMMLKGPCGASFPAGGKNLYVVAKIIEDAKNAKATGDFKFFSEAMSADLKKVAWAAELGDLPRLAQLSKPHVVELLSAGDRDQLLAIRTKVLDTQLAGVKRRFIGEAPDQIDAFHAAIKLSSTFPDSPQGKTAAKLSAALSSDPTFHKEVSAKKYFEAGVGAALHGNEAQTQRLLHNAADEYPDTYYGERAKKLLDVLKEKSQAKTAGAPQLQLQLPAN